MLVIVHDLRIQAIQIFSVPERTRGRNENKLVEQKQRCQAEISSLALALADLKLIISA